MKFSAGEKSAEYIGVTAVTQLRLHLREQRCGLKRAGLLAWNLRHASILCRGAICENASLDGRELVVGTRF